MTKAAAERQAEASGRLLTARMKNRALAEALDEAIRELSDITGRASRGRKLYCGFYVAREMNMSEDEIELLRKKIEWMGQRLSIAKDVQP